MRGDSDTHTVYRINPDLGGPLDFDPHWIDPPEWEMALERIGVPFPSGMPKPVFDFTRILAQRLAPRRTPLHECFSYGPYWIVNDAVWSTLSTIDPEGFDAVPAEVRLRDGAIGPPYWLVTLIRFSDSFNEQRSRENGVRIGERGTPNIGISAPSVFNAATLGDALFFRLPQLEIACFCTERAREALLGAGHTRFHFSVAGYLV